MTVRLLAGRTLRLAAPLYMSTLVVGALPTGLAMLGLWMLAGNRPWRGDLLGPGWLNLTADMLFAATRSGGAGGVSLIWLALLLALPAAMLAQVAVYSFLAGGILDALGAGSSTDARASRGGFILACRRWFWPNVRLSFLAGALVMGATVLGGVLASTVQAVIGPTVAFILQAALQALIWGWIEAARAGMVSEGQRSVGAGLRRGAQVAARPAAILAWLLLAVPTSGFVLAAILPPAVGDAYSPGALLTALVFGQAVAYLGAWTKVIRLAVAVHLVGRANTLERPSPQLPTVTGHG